MSHSTINTDSDPERAEGSLFSRYAISSHLEELGYPDKSRFSFNKCGEFVILNKDGIDYPLFVSVKCSECGVKFIPATYRCNSRICPTCANTRKRRAGHKYLPLLRSFSNPRDNYALRVLTLSPSNYKDLKYGLAHIKQSFTKLMRREYLKKRVKAGLYIIETKQAEDGSWNIHIHSILYCRRLDNHIRGKCLDCGQNLIKFDYLNKKHYCANSNCKSLNVIFKKDSKLVSEFKSSSKTPVNINILDLVTPYYALNYMLKYVSTNKSDFNSPKDVAEYIYTTRKQKLIITFGVFFRYKPPLVKYLCSKCGSPLEISCDSEVSFLIAIQALKPPNLLDFFERC